MRSPAGRLRGQSLYATLLALLIAALPTAAQQPSRWPDTFVARLELLALVQTLNADLLASRSATRTLESWCETHRLAAEPRLVAQPVADVFVAPTAEQRARLKVSDNTPVKYRRVQLRCGTHVLSVAENWYVPERLTPEMNQLLETTTTPFGKAVEGLEPWRQTLAARMLWSPLPADWHSATAPYPSHADRTLVMPEALFEHRALLYTREQQPFAEVVEVYQRGILDFPAPTLH